MLYPETSVMAEHREALFSAAYELYESREDAQDLIQDTYGRMLKRPHAFSGHSEAGYALNALSSTWINNNGARGRPSKTVEFDAAVELGNVARLDPGISIVEVKLVNAAQRELSVSLRQALVAGHMVGLSYREAATTLSLRPGTGTSRLFLAGSELSDRLEREG